MAKQKKSTFERLRSGTMNRQQWRDLGRQLTANDPGLTIVHPHAGGIDVGNESHFVAVPRLASMLRRLLSTPIVPHGVRRSR